ncbi:MAG TPA: SxtJ family membrane protein [Thermoanaerobaculales bacterium]|nr:SxtJ family membrane protein [Thermoanaerobaculales bacterium]HQN95370.1 SxtJ family membrane protein [Thermoanaerobaculales bacterium]HQP42160.1 SxtJ family membrane protein [Thermoanaerobaculales bacterium]
MAVIEINRNPTPKELNQFGFIWLGFLALFGAIARFKLGAPTFALVLWVAAVVVPVAGWLVPPVMRAVFVGMSYAAWPIGFVVSHVVLALVYYLVLTPIGLLMRIFGYDPMTRRFDDQASSYWVARDQSETQPKRYFRQF